VGSGNAREDCITLARRIIEHVSQPISLPDSTVAVGASIGVAIFRAGPSSIERRIQKADAAMYQAKNAGKGCYALADSAESLLPESAFPS